MTFRVKAKSKIWGWRLNQDDLGISLEAAGLWGAGQDARGMRLKVNSRGGNRVELL